MSKAERKKRLRLSCLTILAAGLCGAMLIYLLAEGIPDDSLGYVRVNGTVYPLATRDSKSETKTLTPLYGESPCSSRRSPMALDARVPDSV